jgi:hypothetical protein
MKASIVKLADFLAPKSKYRGGNWRAESAKIPWSIATGCAITFLLLVVAWHVFMGGH